MASARFSLVGLVASLLLGIGCTDDGGGSAIRLDLSALEDGFADADGTPVPAGGDAGIVAAARPGPAHCGWESVWFLTLGFPIGEAGRTDRSTRTYARDVESVLPAVAGEPPLLPAPARLPDDAEPTGLRAGELEIWAADSTIDRYVYVGDGEIFEGWPRIEHATCG